jgi:hypothetical protein
MAANGEVKEAIDSAAAIRDYWPTWLFEPAGLPPRKTKR